MPSPAVFLDRDGILNRLVLNPATGQHEAPQRLQDLSLTQGLGPLVAQLKGAGFSLFVISNQPDAAKKKCTLADLDAIHAALDAGLRQQGVEVLAYYYCRHHPQSLLPELLGPCACRKPSPYFLLKASAEHDLDLGASWLIGDQDSDVQCGQAAGLRCVQVLTPESAAKRGQSKPEHSAVDTADALRIILDSLE